MYTTLLLLFALACSSPEPVATQPELPEPWAQMALPAAGGTFDRVKDGMLRLHYPAGDANALTAHWVEGLRAEGYTVSNPLRVGSARIAEVSRDGQGWVLGVRTRGDHIEVNLAPD